MRLTARLSAFREELARRKLTGFVIPRADQQQNEYVAPSEERLAWLTGFTGSAGMAIVLAQAGRGIRRRPLHPAGCKTGRSQGLEHRAAGRSAARKLADAGISPPATASDLIHGCTLRRQPSGWPRPAPNQARSWSRSTAIRWIRSGPSARRRRSAPVAVHGTQFSGEAEAEKLARIRLEIARLGVDALVLSDSHAVAWTFNIRGADVSHTPLPLSYALVPKDGRPTIFIDHRKLSNSARDHLEQTADVGEPEALTPELTALARRGASDRARQRHRRRRAEPPDRGRRRQAGARQRSRQPAQGRQEHHRDRGHATAHRRDAVALARFLAWIDREAPSGALTEIDAVEALETFRRDTGALKDVSFPTIAGTGPNGAIVHYRVTRKSNRRISPGDLLLINSGAQYEDGTTDVTRTIAIGEPSAEMRDRFTRVLRGHIAIARAVFPDGTTGAQLDTLARQFLWQAGIDFEHGTGHGVGSYLSVHEGPARISKLGTTPLKRGMILSNEPGYYKTDAYGIRIENLELVVGADITGRGKAGERLRDADAGADRPPPDRSEHAERRRTGLAQRLSCPRPPRGPPACRRGHQSVARRRDRAAVAVVMRH